MRCTPHVTCTDPAPAPERDSNNNTTIHHFHTSLLADCVKKARVLTLLQILQTILRRNPAIQHVKPRQDKTLKKGVMAQISPAHGNDSLKEGSNSWEGAEPSQTAIRECKFNVQIDGETMELNSTASCQTYAVAAGQSQFESDSPTEHLREKSQSSSLIAGCSTTPPNASLAPSAETPVVSYTVDPSPVLMQMDSAPAMTPTRPEGQPSSHPASVYITDALTKLANVCSEIDQQGVHASSPVVRPRSETEDARGRTDIQVQLEGVELWQQFHSVDTEMIITRAGRRMFPGMCVSVWGLEPDTRYTLQVEMVPSGKNRFKYINSKWVPVGKADSHEACSLVHTHPDSPASGKQWMRDRVAFKKIKLTNDKSSKKGYVVLNSMHKYQPRLHIFRHLNKKDMEKVYSVDFPETEFMAVTAYQNDLVTQLKIDNNPFAKAFRDGPEEQYAGFPGMMMTTPWGMPTTPLSPVESPFSNGPSSMSPASPLPQFGMTFGNWSADPTNTTRPPFSPALLSKDYPPVAPWSYPMGYRGETPISPALPNGPAMLLPPPFNPHPSVETNTVQTVNTASYSVPLPSYSIVGCSQAMDHTTTEVQISVGAPRDIDMGHPPQME